ncbi:putative RNA editing complex protein MP63 [Trypanosoma theileri]|uniref:Putative RNA editing complex protein MP63 n=1 Tax=Trypanosoma theileri TaxID=67003 RepID=A0A1X0NLZ8_9TRYP|nr:putative RNA editing complex protein MP63 [Trypanosoma theileri]ORC85503.1 putative RNA editing complex protein MP63 [Trypanosoma theileri]
MYRFLLRSAVLECSTAIGVRCFARVPGMRCRTARLRCGVCPPPVAVCQRRHQSTADKKFHCTVCMKAFRLEMAARLHLQQAHGGEGEVAAGPGPGPGSGTESPPAPNTSHPLHPLHPMPPVAPVERNFGDDEDRRPRRQRPTPKPLHQPDREVPEVAMTELLGVWDKVGLSRLEGKFVHSTMVMKVFAARPDASEKPLYESVTPEGDNPFEKLEQVASGGVVSESYVGDEAFTDIDLSGPFAAAPDYTLNPFRAGRVDNPFTKTSTPQYEVNKPLKQLQQQQQQQQQKEEPVTAPITPFGQLPLFGKQQVPKETITPNTSQPKVSDVNEVSSPFSAAVSDSPFTGKVNSPFASDFGDVATPFESSPFTATSPFTVPGMQQTSPFTTTDAASPFAQTGSTFPSTFPMTVGVPNIATMTQQEQSVPAPEHECPTCGKKFTTFDGAAMHSKAKHGIVLEGEKKDKGKHQGRNVPDLPAYIPSPVDLSSTSPFGMKTTVSASWAETELIPHAQCISNITIVGRVLDITQTLENVSQVTVFVQGEENGEEETMTLHCSGDINAKVRDTLKRNATVFVSGTLRLHPVYEATNNKYYMSPVVHVALPTGTLAVIT